MKSLSQKIIILIFISILVSTLLVGIASVLNFHHSLEDNSHQILSLSCNESMQEINNVFSRIEQSTDVLAEYAKENFADARTFKSDATGYNEFMNDITNLGFSIMQETEGAATCYFRIDPVIAGDPKAGFLISKNFNTGTYDTADTTDLSLYSEKDHYVYWFYGPKETKTAMWLEPYYYKNIQVEIITYTKPIYIGGTFVGVVGMDVDFKHITKIVDDVKVYETGYAFLTDKNLNVIHSKHEFANNLKPGGDKELTYENIKNASTVWEFKDSGKKMGITFSELINGMCLAVTVSRSEVHHDLNSIIIQTIAVLIFTTVVFFFITTHFTKTLIDPLKRLNDISTEIARGNLDVYFEYNTEDEIGTLAKNTMVMVKQLKKRIGYIDTIAYTDNMTGLKNYTAYKRDLEAISKSLLQGNSNMGVFVIDINGLKSINDTLGHRHGNDLIVCSGKIVANTFGYENVYRIGGDEFVAILQNACHDECIRYIEALKTKLEEPHGNIVCSLAFGFAIGNADNPVTYDDLFEEADKSMYFDKLQKKSRGENSRFLDK